MVDLRPAVGEYIDGFVDLAADGYLEIGLQRSFAFFGAGEDLAPGIDDLGMAAQVHAIIQLAGAVGRDDEEFILDGAGAQQGVLVHDAGSWPGGGHEEDGDVLQCQAAGGFREADIIADEGGTFYTVDGIGCQAVAWGEVVFLSARSE